jgi:hypothetical protein
MHNWVDKVFAFVLFFASLPLGTWAAPPIEMNMPEAITPVTGAVVPGETKVQVISHKGEWGSMFSMEGGGEPIFVVTGQLENHSNAPLTYVKLQCELLSEDKVVMFRDYVYNRKAEVLRDEEYETGKKTLADMNVTPIDKGAQDGFRFFFFKSEVPEFQSYRIRVLAIR